MADSTLPPPLPDDDHGTRGDRLSTETSPGSERDEFVERFSEEGDDVLIGVSFDDVFKAQEFLLAVSRLASTGQLALRDAVIVVKDHDGKTRIRETIDPQPGRSALSGAVWSGLLGMILGGPVGWLAGLGIGAASGAITARIVDLGIPDEWVDWFKQAVQPHTATVVVLVGDVDLPSLHSEAARFVGADLVHTTLKPGARDALAAAFEVDDTDSPTDSQ